MKKKILLAAFAAFILACIILAGVLFRNVEIPQQAKANHFTYSLSAGNKTYGVLVEANWDQENPPTVTLSNGTRHAVVLYFLGGTKKTVTYTISIPTELLSGNLSLVHKYYVLNPDRYTLTSNATCNSLKIAFDYDPPFSGSGYFEIVGTEGATSSKLGLNISNS
jgi:hypothetical protein